MNPAVGSIYSFITFAVLAAAFVGATHALFGWEAVPSDSRTQATLMLLWYALSGYFAMLVGRHRDVLFFEALRRGSIDLGRKLKGMVLR